MLSILYDLITPPFFFTSPRPPPHSPLSPPFPPTPSPPPSPPPPPPPPPLPPSPHLLPLSLPHSICPSFVAHPPACHTPVFVTSPFYLTPRATAPLCTAPPILSHPPCVTMGQLEENKRLRGERVEDGTVTVDKPLALDEDELEFLEAVEQVSQ
ncbi:unnamed protein product [Closterium sp. NIES-64]|nr:unnamed protein product [Closterium sp. NIES-64]